MRLRLPELIEERGLTVYGFAKLAAEHGISQRQAYRLASGEVSQVPLETLDILCQIFGIRDPGPLFVKVRGKRT